MCLWAPLLLSAAQVAGGGFDKIALFPGDVQGDRMGASVAALGDLDGDGLRETAACAPDATISGMPKAGLVRVYSGAGGGVLYEYTGSASFERLGRAVLALGDLDGDLVDDFAFSSDAGSGTVFLVSGASGLTLLSLSGPVGSGDFGQALAAPGDLDGDSIPDLAVGDGAFDYDDGLGTVLFDAGGAWFLSGLDGSVIQAFHGDAAGDRFGATLACPGDSSGDGFPDLLAGARSFDPPGLVDAGAVFLRSGADGSAVWRFDGSAAAAFFPTALAAVGDTDGDGYGDFLAGARLDEPAGGFDQGSAVLVSTDPAATLMQTWYGSAPQEHFGAALGTAGDVNEDGIVDLMIGAPGPAYGGRVYIYSGADHARLWISESEGTADGYGGAVAGAGDLDNDGRLDLLVGATDAPGPNGLAGVVHLLSFRQFAIPSRSEISALSGGTATWNLKFPDDFLRQDDRLFYLTLIAEAPGLTVVQGWQVPLEQDLLFSRSLQGQHPDEMILPAGPLSAAGAGTVQAALPGNLPPVMIGKSWYLAFGCYELTDAGELIVHAISRRVELTILP